MNLLFLKNTVVLSHHDRKVKDNFVFLSGIPYFLEQILPLNRFCPRIAFAAFFHTSEIMIALEQFLQLGQAQYANSQIAADTAFRDSQLTAEVLATYDDDDDDPYLTSDDDEHELQAKEFAVYCSNARPNDM